MTERISVGLVRVGHFAGGPVIVVGQVAEVGADIVGDLQRVEARIVGEQAAVVGGDVEAGVAASMARNRPRKFSQIGSGL